MYATRIKAATMGGATAEYGAPYFHDECVDAPSRLVWLGRGACGYTSETCSACGATMQAGKRKARIRIAPGRYRDRQGFNISGTDLRGRRVRIFTESRDSAEHIRKRIRDGLEIRAEDFRAQS